MNKKRGITIRLGPLGLSLLAAGITAIGVAAVSFADSGNGGSSPGKDSSGNGTQTFRMQGPPGGGPGVGIMGADLSSSDRQKLEDFRKCMDENGAPAPADPGQIDPSDGPPQPPSAADREKAQKAFEACKSKLPEKLQNGGPPGGAMFHCGPPPGAPPLQGQDQQGDSQQGQNKDQSKDQSNSAAPRSSGSAT